MSEARMPDSKTNIFRDLKWILILAVIFYMTRLKFKKIQMPDDLFFEYMNNPANSLAIANYQNGRFFAGALFYLIEFFDLDVFTVLKLAEILSIFAFCALSYIFCALLNSGIPVVVRFFASAMIALHPYNTTYFDFTINQVNGLIAVVATALAMWTYSSQRTVYGFIASVFLLVVATANYQTTPYYFIMFVIAMSLLHNNDNINKNTSIKRGLIIFTLSFIIYFALYKLTIINVLSLYDEINEPLLTLFYEGNSRSRIIQLPEAFLSGVKYIGYLVRSLVWEEPIFPSELKFIILFIVLIPIIIWIGRCVATGGVNKLLVSRKVKIIALLIIFSGSPIHFLLAQEYLPVRNLMHVSTLFSTLYLFGWLVSTSRVRVVALGAGAVIPVIFGFLTLDIAIDQRHIAKRDRELAEDIVRSAYRSPGFNADAPFIVAGRLRYNSQHMGDIDAYLAINRSRFTAQWSVIPLLSKALGRRIKHADPDLEPAARRLCEARAPITDLYLLISDGRNNILCLEDLTYVPPYH